MKINCGGHEIEIIAFGTRKIFYDGTLISLRKSIFGSTHIFTVIENGEDIQYEIKVGLKWHGLSEKISIRRNGCIIYSDHYHEGIRIDKKTSLTKTQQFLSGLQRVSIVAILVLIVATANYINKAETKEVLALKEEIALLDRFERMYRRNITNKIIRAMDYSNPVVRDYAARLAAKYPGEYNLNQMSSIYDDVYQKWKYVDDPKGEYISPASRTIQNGFIGDCDDYAVLMCSLLYAVGGECRIVLAFGNDGNHVYPEAEFEAKQESLDRINSHYAGALHKESGLGPVRRINYNSEPDGQWLNLDRSSKYPGGAFFNAEKYFIIYPNGSYKVKEKGGDLKRRKYLRLTSLEKRTAPGKNQATVPE